MRGAVERWNVLYTDCMPVPNLAASFTVCKLYLTKYIKHTLKATEELKWSTELVLHQSEPLDPGLSVTVKCSVLGGDLMGSKAPACPCLVTLSHV